MRAALRPVASSSSGSPMLIPEIALNHQAAATEYIQARGCDDSLERAEEQDKNSKLDDVLMIAKGGLLITIKMLHLDQAGAFLQGAASAVVEDWTAPVTNIASAISGQEFVNTLTPFMGNQAAMSIGRIVGHAVSVVGGELGALTGLGIAGIGGVGGMALVPVSGGSTVAVSVASVAAGAAVTAYSGSAAVNAINNLFNDPNIQFAASKNSSSSTGTGLADDIADDFTDDAASGGLNGLPADQGYSSFGQLKNAIGSAGEGKDWHHIVEQSQIAKSGFTAEQIHNTSNVIAIDHATHMQITAYYNTKSFDFTNGSSVRDWLAGQSLEVQYQFGVI